MMKKGNGMSTAGEPGPRGRRLRSLSTEDLHHVVGGSQVGRPPQLLPGEPSPDQIIDKYNQT